MKKNRKFNVYDNGDIIIKTIVQIKRIIKIIHDPANRYWVFVYAAYFFLSLTCLMLFVVTSPGINLLILIFIIGVILVPTVINGIVLVNLADGKDSYDYKEKLWRYLLNNKQNDCIE